MNFVILSMIFICFPLPGIGLNEELKSSGKVIVFIVFQ